MSLIWDTRAARTRQTVGETLAWLALGLLYASLGLL